MNLQDVLNSLLKENIITFMDFEIYKNIRDLTASDILGILALIVNFNLQKGDSCIELESVASKDLSDILEGTQKIGYTLPSLDRILNEFKNSAANNISGLLTLRDNKLFFKRVFDYESNVAQILSSLSKHKSRVNMDDIECKQCDFWQKLAVAMSASSRLLIISGGPGTGKTTTIKKIIEHLGKNKNIGLCAPTGKAVSRMIESLKGVDVNPPMTLHRFLKANEDLTRFHYNQDNKLPFDVVIVDEASMVNIELAYRLLSALKEDSTLILIGDKDQLSSVEAGAFLGEICSFKDVLKLKTLNVFSKDFVNRMGIAADKQPQVKENIRNNIIDCSVELIRNFRFSEQSKIKALSDAIRRGDVKSSLDIIKSGEGKDLVFKETLNESIIESIMKEYAAAIKNSVENSFEKIKVLTPLRISKYGSMSLNELIDRHLRRHFLTTNIWYPGKQIIISANDYQNGLFNGDMGVCLERSGKIVVKFNKSEEDIIIEPEFLPQNELAFAMSVHKSQGSEFDTVYFIVGNQAARVLTRELIYTAVTRARKKVYIVGSIDVIAKGLENKTKRKSALGDMLYGSLYKEI